VRTCDVGGADVVRAPKGQGSGGVNDDVDGTGLGECATDGARIADVTDPEDGAGWVFRGNGGGDVQGDDRDPLHAQVVREVHAKEACAAGNENSHGHRLNGIPSGTAAKCFVISDAAGAVRVWPRGGP